MTRPTRPKAPLGIDEPIEPERYELFEEPRYRFDLDRRDFVKLLGGGIVVCLLADSAALAQEQQQPGRGRGGFGGGASQDLSAWIHVDAEGQIVGYTGKVEIGQNARTSLSQAVADELRVPLVRVNLVMADTDLTPFDGGTVGSGSTPRMAPQMRRAAATMRELLIDLAAAQLKVPRDALVAGDGQIIHVASDRRLTYGQVAKDQKLTKVVANDVPLTAAKDWRIAGVSTTKVSSRHIVTGKHAYASDISRPGMLHGKVLRGESIHAKLASVDVKEAEAMEGVTVVRDGEFLGVTAPTQRTAERALAAIGAQWTRTPQPTGSDFIEEMKKSHAADGGAEARPTFTQGSIESGLASAAHKLRASYTIAWIAHAPLEPRASVAEFVDGKLTVWTGTQRPFGVRDELARAFSLPADKVRVIVPDMGSGYGGKHSGEAAVECARLAKAAGKPVKLVWTREEEFTWAYFRPAGVIEIASGISADGTLVAWDFHNYNSGASAIRTLYDAPHQRITFHQARSPLRQGSYRALAATANHFARESHMDDLAHAVGFDPLEFRLKNTKDARLRAVLEAAARQFGWAANKSTPERGFGIAGGSEKGSYVATCAEVAIDRAAGRLKVERLVTAFECGAVVNPDHLKNQVEGAAVQALGGALFESITYQDDQIANPRFSRYRVPRFSDTPKLETVLVDRKDLPSAGAGETPIVAVAPAIGNAIFHATGTRLTGMPMAVDKLKA